MENLFYKQINNCNALRKNREGIRDLVLLDLNHLPFLMTIAFDPFDRANPKACWILELVLEKQPHLLTPYLDSFCNTLPKYTNQSALRAIAKSSLYITKHLVLQPKQERKIIETCFDWLILENTKVATKVYAIRTLFELGKKNHSIHADLKRILIEDYPKNSAAFQAVARELIKKIK